MGKGVGEQRIPYRTKLPLSLLQWEDWKFMTFHKHTELSGGLKRLHSMSRVSVNRVKHCDITFCAYSLPLARCQQNMGLGNFCITCDKEKPTSHPQDNVLTCAMGCCRLLQGEDNDSMMIMVTVNTDGVYTMCQVLFQAQ